MGKITSPTLVIHGTDDEIINISHGYDIVNNCPGAVEPLWVKVSSFLEIEILSLCIRPKVTLKLSGKGSILAQLYMLFGYKQKHFLVKYSCSKKKIIFVLLQGGGHSNIPTHFEDEFYERVKRFISIDMTNNQYSKVYFI